MAAATTCISVAVALQVLLRIWPTPAAPAVSDCAWVETLGLAGGRAHVACAATLARGFEASAGDLWQGRQTVLAAGMRGSWRHALGLPLDLNRATPAELRALEGIGPHRAQAIVAYRQLHGPFRSLGELRQISGVGAKTLQRLQGDLFVHAPREMPQGVAPAP